VLPQAMAAGLPIVATAVDGTAEVVINGDNGILVPPGDRQKLSEAITSLLCDRRTAANMGKNGRSRVAEFSAQKMAEDIDRLYQTLLQKNS
jgi:glycosyltransferase involved in cell wall biosynthesis